MIFTNNTTITTVPTNNTLTTHYDIITNMTTNVICLVCTNTYI